MEERGNDSVAVRVDDGVQFRPVQLALPASLVAAGALGMVVPPLKAANEDVRDALAVGGTGGISGLTIICNTFLSCLMWD